MTRKVDFSQLPTERAAPPAPPLDTLDARALVALIHGQDRLALDAVGRAAEAVTRGAEAIHRALEAGGRLIYVGAGTSGRLAALDAAECPPTFGTRPSQVTAIMAGGRRALHSAVEGAEDRRGDGRAAIRAIRVSSRDLVCGVSASGVTPFVRAALAEARRRRAATLLVSCGPERWLRGTADQLILLDVGPEVIAGSTRMKAGLATKAVLHTLTTTAMIRMGKVYGPLMVEVSPSNTKLRRRAAQIVERLTGLSAPGASALLRRAGGSAKIAAVMYCARVDAEHARWLLAERGGRLREVIGDRP